MCEEDYMGFEPDPDNHHAAGTSSDGVLRGVGDEADKEAGEFLLNAILRLCGQDKQISWPDIYSWCAANVRVFCESMSTAPQNPPTTLQHGSKSTVEYWRSLNSPGYQVHAPAMALRQEMSDLSKDSDDDLTTLLNSARKAYPTRIAPPTQPTACASEAKEGKCKTNLHQQAILSFSQHHEASQPARAYSMDEERAGLKDLLLAQSSKSDFAPWTYRWWKRFEPLVRHFLNHFKLFF